MYFCLHFVAFLNFNISTFCSQLDNRNRFVYTGCPTSLAILPAVRPDPGDLNSVIFGDALFQDSTCRDAGCHGEISLRRNLVEMGCSPYVCVPAITVQILSRLSPNMDLFAKAQCTMGCHRSKINCSLQRICVRVIMM